METKNKYWVPGRTFNDHIREALLQGPFDAVFETDNDVVLVVPKYPDKAYAHSHGLIPDDAVEHHRFPRCTVLNQVEHDAYVARYSDIKPGDYVAVMIEPKHPDWMPRLIRGFVVELKKPNIVYVITDDGTVTKPNANAKHKTPWYRTLTCNIIPIARPDEESTS